MPIYEYKCKKCGKYFDILVGSEADVSCIFCGGDVEKQTCRFNFKLQGDGWAKDGYSKRRN